MPKFIEDKVEPPQGIQEIINAEEENLPEIQKFANNRDVILITIIGSYFGRRYNPSTSVSAIMNIRDEFGIEKILTEIQEKIPDYKNKKLYLLVNSVGGSLSSAYKIARAIRDSFSDITVFVPHFALSGGSLLALTGNRIRMGMMSQLSPLDVQVFYEELGQQVSVNSLFRSLKTLNKIFSTHKPEELPYTYTYMAEGIDPIIYEEWVGIQSEGRFYLDEILEKSGYTNIERIRDLLTLEFPTHGFVIHYDRAKDIGLKVEKHDTDIEAWNIMRLWLSQYITKQTDRHFIRYAVPKKEDKISEKPEVKGPKQK
jgi:hypothetical protein